MGTNRRWGLALLVVLGCKDKAPSPAPVVPRPVPAEAVAKAPAAIVGDGSFVLPAAEGARLEGSFENGKRAGTWTSWYAGAPSLKAAEFRYAAGVREGAFATWTPRGQPWLSGTCTGGKCSASTTAPIEALALIAAPMTPLTAPVSAVASMHGGSTLLAVDQTGKVLAWTAQGQFKELVALPGPVVEPPVALPNFHAAFRTDGGEAHVVDTRSGEVVQRLTGVTGPLSGVQHFGGGVLLAGLGTTVALFGPDGGEPLWTLEGEAAITTRAPLVSHDGRNGIVFGDASGALNVTHTGAGSLKKLAMDAEILDVAADRSDVWVLLRKDQACTLVHVGLPGLDRTDVAGPFPGLALVEERDGQISVLAGDQLIHARWDDGKAVTHAVTLPASGRAAVVFAGGHAVIAGSELLLVDGPTGYRDGKVGARFPLPASLKCDGPPTLQQSAHALILGCPTSAELLRVEEKALGVRTVEQLSLWNTGAVDVGDAVDGVFVGARWEPKVEKVLHAVDARSGAVLWKHEHTEAWGAGGDAVAIAVDKRTVVLRHRVNGDALWKHALPGDVVALVVSGDGVFALYSTDADTFVRKIGVDDGRERFTTALGARKHDSGTTVMPPEMKAEGGRVVVTRLTPLTGTATLALVHPVDGNKVGFAGEAAAVEGGVLWFTAQGMLKGVKLEGGEEVRSVVLHAKSNWTCGELHVSGADLHASCLPPGEEPSGGKQAVHHAVGRAKGNRRGLNPGGPSCGCAKTSRAVTEGPWTYWPMATDVGLTIVRLGPQLHALPSPLPRLDK